MIGSLMSLGGYLLVLFVLTVWMCVKIWRRSPLLAIGSFLFWPLALVALVLYWKDEEADIKLPFFLSVAVGLLAGYMAMRTVTKGVEEMAWQLTDEDIAQIRAENPSLAQQLEQARAHGRAARGGDAPAGTAGEAVEAGTVHDGDFAPSDKVVAQREVTAAEAEAQQRAELEMAAQALSWRFGVLDLAPSGAHLTLPRDFRFVPRSQVFRVARLRGTPLSNDVLGWIVHRQVDLARDDAWYVQVRYLPMERLPAFPRLLGDKTLDAQVQAGYAMQLARALRGEGKAQAAAWDPSLLTASWQWLSEDPDAPYRDYVAVKPLPGGLLEFSVPMLHAVHAELGERAARLMAARTAPATQAP